MSFCLEGWKRPQNAIKCPPGLGQGCIYSLTKFALPSDSWRRRIQTQDSVSSRQFFTQRTWAAPLIATPGYSYSNLSGRWGSSRLWAISQSPPFFRLSHPSHASGTSTLNWGLQVWVGWMTVVKKPKFYQWWLRHLYFVLWGLCFEAGWSVH